MYKTFQRSERTLPEKTRFGRIRKADGIKILISVEYAFMLSDKDPVSYVSENAT